MLFSHTLIAASTSSILAIGVSILSLVIAIAAWIMIFSKTRIQDGRISKYAQVSKFNQLQIRHHDNRLNQLEKRRRTKGNTIPFVASKDEKKKTS